ncbi:MAG: sigma-70 family RNA polymerase sigma factor [Acidimicrobiales bacterium]
MNQDTRLAERFEEHRGRLKAVAYRMLGSPSEADDAVQEAWIRYSRSDTSDVENLGGWLTTVVSRVCLTQLQSRRAHPEVPADDHLADGSSGLGADPWSGTGFGADPEAEALLADSIGFALLIVLDALTPAERVALVLHDMFAVPFEDIGPIVGRNAAAARQLASRARRRVRSQEAGPDADRVQQASLVEAFFAASRQGDFNRLLAVLDPDVVMRADAAAVKLGASAEVHGPADVFAFTKRAAGAQMALLDGQPGAVWIPGGQLRVAIHFTVRDGRIAEVNVIADQEPLVAIDVKVTEEPWVTQRRGHPSH